MNDPNTSQPTELELVARALKGELSAEEKANFQGRLDSEPALRSFWEAEQALERALDRLPDAPVPSNFAKLVLQEAMRTPAQAKDRQKFSLRWVLARFALGFAAMALLAASLLQQRQKTHLQEVAETMNAFHDTALAVSGTEAAATEIFQNFETIEQLSLPAESELDMELLVALQK
jgi:anti-sigma factor RsiW